MHKISNFTGSARHGWERMTPNIGFGGQRQHLDSHHQPHQQLPGPGMPHNNNNSSNVKPTPGSMPRQTAPRHNPLSLSFNVPFSSSLAGPPADDVIHASPGAFERWTHPPGTEEGVSNHKLPVHRRNEEGLREMCKQMSARSEGKLQANVTSSEPRPIPGLQLGPLKALVTNVCLSGEPELVRQMRATILNNTPISLKCATVDIDQVLIGDPATNGIRANVLEHMDYAAKFTGTDIFLLRPKQIDIETTSFNGVLDNSLDHRFRIAVYGDQESAEHAKTRILIMVDQILKRTVDIFKVEHSLHPLICGRLRRNIKQIESATNTAIYFPPSFPQVYGYVPPEAHRRGDDEIYITGEERQDIYAAKQKLSGLVMSTSQAMVKDVRVSPDKIDSILLERLDKIETICEHNSTYVLFPQVGSQRPSLRVQGHDMLHIERTLREIMAISGQFYAATWYIQLTENQQRAPNATDIKNMLADICISSGADISFEKLTFHISGSDDSVKAALWIINTLPFVKRAASTLRIKLELANEHKEFVSGKKNGKINKIMSSSNVQIFFDLFNEYNFFIDVSGQTYDAAKNGLDLVEQEMPAQIAFHVPDQYHKRIIGIGGSHIQRIMKKYSVFVKFSNAMDRGGASKEDDDIKVDNVICRTPARNAQTLDLVKQEIMDMVEKADAEFVSEHVIVNRLYHRELLARLASIEELEKKWNCKVVFPSTEQASDVVTVTGPEYQVPQAVDEFLGMVPQSHEISLATTASLASYFATTEFQQEVVAKLKSQYEIDLHVNGLSSAEAAEAAEASQTEILTLSYTRNNIGGLKDAIDFLTTQLVAHGLDASTVKGAIPRPKSDSFEESLPFFESKLLHGADPTRATDSPTRSIFGNEDNTERSFFDKLRKPGSISSFSSFLERRKNNGSRSPNTFMKHASANASKASLISLESLGSAYRNPWNDSGVNLTEDDASGTNGWPARFLSPGSSTAVDKTIGSNPHAGTSSASLAIGSTPLPPPSSHSQSSSLHHASGAGDSTPKHDTRESHDSGRPSTAQSSSSAVGPGPIGPPR